MNHDVGTHNSVGFMEDDIEIMTHASSGKLWMPRDELSDLLADLKRLVWGSMHVRYLIFIVGYNFWILGMQAGLVTFIATAPPRFPVCDLDEAASDLIMDNDFCLPDVPLPEEDCVTPYHYIFEGVSIVQDFVLQTNERCATTVYETAGFGNIVFLAGIGIGAFNHGLLMDRIGRKGSLLLALGGSSISGAMQLVTRYYDMWLFSRFCVAMSLSGAALSSITNLWELTNSRNRRKVLAYSIFSLFSGLMSLGFLSLLFHNWKLLLFTITGPMLLMPGLLCCVRFNIESFHYYLASGQTDKAFSTLLLIAACTEGDLVDKLIHFGDDTIVEFVHYLFEEADNDEELVMDEDEFLDSQTLLFNNVQDTPIQQMEDTDTLQDSKILDVVVVESGRDLPFAAFSSKPTALWMWLLVIFQTLCGVMIATEASSLKLIGGEGTAIYGDTRQGLMAEMFDEISNQFHHLQPQINDLTQMSDEIFELVTEEENPFRRLEQEINLDLDNSEIPDGEETIGQEVLNVEPQLVEDFESRPQRHSLLSNPSQEISSMLSDIKLSYAAIRESRLKDLRGTADAYVNTIRGSYDAVWDPEHPLYAYHENLRKETLGFLAVRVLQFFVQTLSIWFCGWKVLGRNAISSWSGVLAALLATLVFVIEVGAGAMGSDPQRIEGVEKFVTSLRAFAVTLASCGLIISTLLMSELAPASIRGSTAGLSFLVTTSSIVGYLYFSTPIRANDQVGTISFGHDGLAGAIAMGSLGNRERIMLIVFLIGIFVLVTAGLLVYLTVPESLGRNTFKDIASLQNESIADPHFNRPCGPARTFCDLAIDRLTCCCPCKPRSSHQSVQVFSKRRLKRFALMLVLEGKDEMRSALKTGKRNWNKVKSAVTPTRQRTKD